MYIYTKWKGNKSAPNTNQTDLTKPFSEKVGARIFGPDRLLSRFLLNNCQLSIQNRGQYHHNSMPKQVPEKIMTIIKNHSCSICKSM